MHGVQAEGAVVPARPAFKWFNLCAAVRAGEALVDAVAEPALRFYGVVIAHVLSLMASRQPVKHGQTTERYAQVLRFEGQF